MEQAALSAVTAFDEPFFQWLSAYLDRWPLLNLFFKWLLDAHLVKFVPIVLVLIGFWFARRGDQERTRCLVAEAVLTGFAALFIARLLALTLPFRERPFGNPEFHLSIPLEAGLRTWSSFPSDHAVMAFALAAALVRISPWVGLWAAVHAALFICVPRLYFGLHYPSDVVGGALIGIVIAWLIAHAPGRSWVSGRVLAFERRLPALFYATAFFLLFEIAEMFNSVRILVVNLFRVLHQAIG